jgi:hypothetical protein
VEDFFLDLVFVPAASALEPAWKKFKVDLRQNYECQISDTWQTYYTTRPLPIDVEILCLSRTFSKLAEFEEKLSDSIFSATSIGVRLA